MRMRHVAMAFVAALWFSGIARAQVGDFWLIENSTGDHWMVQEGRQKQRKMDKYEALARADKITCVKAPCDNLRYLTESGKMEPFPPSKTLKPGELFAV